MFGNRDIPVYLFTGFLESGKSTCFQEILEEGNFEDGLRTLYLMTEEGEKEVDEMLLRHNKVDTVLIEDEEDLTEDKCKELVKQYKPARIVIEVNGMWDLVKLINETIPENWIVVQTFTTVNAETFSVYINNMKSLIMSHFQQSDLVIFNRCSSDMDKASMRRNVKAINRLQLPQALSSFPALRLPQALSSFPALRLPQALSLFQALRLPQALSLFQALLSLPAPSLSAAVHCFVVPPGSVRCCPPSPAPKPSL